MNNLLIPVSMLATKLGKTITDPSAEFGRAAQSIWTVSVRARDIAGKSVEEWPGYDADDDNLVPEAVKVVVLDAAYRVYKNPDRYLMNQAFQFTGQVANELDGDIFLRAEREILEKYCISNGMWTVTTTRLSEVFDPTGYVAVEGSTQPFPYYGAGEG